jgi:hypothetical protein
MPQTRAKDYGSVYDSVEPDEGEIPSKWPFFPMFKETSVSPSLPSLSAPEKYPVHFKSKVNFSAVDL